MYLFRCNYGRYLLALVLTLTLAGAGWPQTAATPAPDANPYRQAVALLDRSEQELTAGNRSAAQSLMKQSLAIFTRLQTENADKLKEHELSAQESQQLAINQKLANEAQAKADPLLETAAAKKKQAEELRNKGQEEAADAAERASRDQFLQAQALSIKSAIYALRNQQIIFRFLAP